MNRSSPAGLKIAMTVFAYLAGVSCSNTSSEFVATDGVYATLIARSEGTGSTEVSATLRVGDSPSFDYVDLKGGDFLTAKRIDPVTMAEEDRLMFEEIFLSRVSYHAIFSGQGKDTAFEVALDRSASGKASAPDSSATLPTPFALKWVDDPVLMTPAPASFSRSASMPYFVIWDPFDAPDLEPGDELLYSVTGSCILSYLGGIDWEAGEDVLQLTGVLQDRAPPNAGSSCPLEVKITLRRTGTLDPAFSGGSFVAEQVRSLTLQSNP